MSKVNKQKGEFELVLPKLSVFGREIPDPNPMEMPIGFKRPESLAEQVRRLVRTEEWEKLVRDQGFETFEESEDFDIGDDFDPSSPYEVQFDPELGREISEHEFRQNYDRYREDFKKRYRNMLRQEDLEDAFIRAKEERRRTAPPAEQSGPKAAQEPPKPKETPDR